MITRTPGVVHVENVMWQPQFNCEVDCKGCYVAESLSSKFQGLNTDILELVFLREKILCSQFTISLDTVNHHDERLALTLRGLWNFYREAQRCNCENTTRFEHLPELCVTAFNLDTVKGWAYEMGLTLEQFLYPLTVLSLSNMPAHRDIAEGLHILTKESKTTLNYNRMVTKSGVSDTAFQVGVENSDQTYLVLEKAPLGGEQSVDAIDRWFQARSKVPSDKLAMDACIEDSTQKIREGIKCGAGISKIHVWPTGAVSGCPYDAHHVITGVSTEPVNVFEEVERAVLDRPCHSMDKCTIASALQDLMKKRKNQAGAVA